MLGIVMTSQDVKKGTSVPLQHSIRARVAACVLCFIFSAALLPVSAFADVRGTDLVRGTSIGDKGLSSAYCPNIVAEAAFAVSEDGSVYFERNQDERRHIASLTKVMTALVALKYADPSTTTVTISQTAATIGESSAMLQTGDTMTLETALKALMVPSGNDAAQGIAESLGGSIRDQLRGQGATDVPDGDYDAFVYAMNKTAADIGMNDSKFANPHGLDFDKYDQEMYCTARDVATMCLEAMRNDTFRSIVSQGDTTITVQRGGSPVDVALTSTDILIGSYDGACGIKTGFTEKAGECFAGAVERDGKLLISVVLGSSSEQQRFDDSTTLDDWVYGNTVDYPLVNSSESTEMIVDGKIETVPVVAYVSHAGWIDKTFKATASNPDASTEVFALDGNVSQQISFDDVGGSVEPGQKVGQITYYQHNEVIGTQDLVAAEACAAPNPLEAVGIWWDRVMRSFSGEPGQAESYVVADMPLIYGPNASLGASQTN